MKKGAIIGTYWNTVKDAKEDVRKKSRIFCPHRRCKDTHFVILTVKKGYLVVSDKQFE